MQIARFARRDEQSYEPTTRQTRNFSWREEDVIPIDPMDLRVPRLIALDSGIHTHACDLLRDVRIFPNGINRETVSVKPNLDFFSTLLNNNAGE